MMLTNPDTVSTNFPFFAFKISKFIGLNLLPTFKPSRLNSLINFLFEMVDVNY